MTKRFEGGREAPPLALTALPLQHWTVYKRAESNPARHDCCRSSPAIQRPVALAQLEAR